MRRPRFIAHLRGDARQARGASTRAGLLLPYVVLLVVTLALPGCGVGATDRPVDEGEAAAGDSTGTGAERKDPPEPQEAESSQDLIGKFLQAAAGGLTAANDRLKLYLTPEYQRTWPDPVPLENPPLTVVRVVDGPNQGLAVDGRTPFTIRYETIGSLTDHGRVDDLAQLPTGTLTFWLVPEPTLDSAPRIAEIQGWPAGLLLLSDEGLRTYYQVQPVYFWDTGYRLLVPDVRYLPLTLSPEQRAGQILEWLGTGPSPWLGGVQRLPSGASFESVTEIDNKFVVDISAATAGIGEEALTRLMYQLQWSLSSLSEGEPGAASATGADIELTVDGQDVPVAVGPEDFRAYNHSYTYRAAPTRYDITDDGVVSATGDAGQAVLSSSANSAVVWAAIADGGRQAAYVRSLPSGRAHLQLVRSGEAEPRDTSVPHRSTLGRPSFVPQSEVVLVPTGGDDGRLLSVSTRSGDAIDAAQGLTGVTAAAVSPDGRRVAIVADGAVYVAALVVGNDVAGNEQVTVASTRRRLLAGRLDARTVVWTAESGLLVAGAGQTGPAFWKVTPDGVLAEDLSGDLRGLSVDDLVCHPRWGYPWWTAGVSRPDVHAITGLGVYSYRNRLFSEVPTLVNPFFGT